MFRIMDWLVTPSARASVFDLLAAVGFVLFYGLWQHIVRRREWTRVWYRVAFVPFIALGMYAQAVYGLYHVEGRFRYAASFLATLIGFATLGIFFGGIMHIMYLCIGYFVGMIALACFESALEKIASWRHPTTLSC